MPLTDASAAEKMRAIVAEYGGGDIEGAHLDADDLLEDILQELGYPELVAAYRAVEKWYA